MRLWVLGLGDAYPAGRIAIKSITTPPKFLVYSTFQFIKREGHLIAITATLSVFSVHTHIPGISLARQTQ